VLLYLHGGGFVAGSAANHRPLTAALARLTARRVFSLDYRLAPEHRFPAPVEDVIAGYRWLLDQGVPPGGVALAGDSAGGGLVLSALLQLRDQSLPLPTRAVCFSPWTDLTGSSESHGLNGGRDAMFHRENMAAFAGAYLGPASPLDPLASPLLGDLGRLPPLLLQVGSGELLLDDARRVHDKVQRARGSSRLEVFEDVCHAWQMLYPWLPEARVALQQAAAFLSET
jgi:acetyl esterase/lipase